MPVPAGSGSGGNGTAFQPFLAERSQRDRLKRFLQQREHRFLLAPEMFARGRQRLFQQPLRLLRLGRAVDAFEVVVNFVMILMQLVQLIQRPVVGEGMVQGRIGQVRFRFAMTA